MTKGQRIRELREKNHISQVELAEKINVSKQLLYKYENDIITNIPSDKIETLALFFNVTPSYIMGWETCKDIKAKESTSLRPDEEQLLSSYNTLNSIGKDKALEYVSDLTENKKYTKDTESHVS